MSKKEKHNDYCYDPIKELVDENEQLKAENESLKSVKIRGGKKLIDSLKWCYEHRILSVNDMLGCDWIEHKVKEELKQLKAYKKAWKTLTGFIFNRQYCAGYEVQTKLILDILDKMQELEPKTDGER